MSLIRNAIHKFAETPVPDPVSRSAIGFLVATARRKLADPPAGIENAFAREMSGRPIAEHTQAANDQHYEVPSAFFQACLGPRLKYSSCLYRTGKETLGEAEGVKLAWKPSMKADVGESDAATLLKLIDVLDDDDDAPDPTDEPDDD